MESLPISFICFARMFRQISFLNDVLSIAMSINFLSTLNRLSISLNRQNEKCKKLFPCRHFGASYLVCLFFNIYHKSATFWYVLLKIVWVNLLLTELLSYTNCSWLFCRIRLSCWISKRYDFLYFLKRAKVYVIDSLRRWGTNSNVMLISLLCGIFPEVFLPFHLNSAKSEVQIKW